MLKKTFIPSNSMQILINNKIINQVTSTKFLGIEINSIEGWKEHISVVNKKVARAIGIISRIRYKLSVKTSMLLYDSLILSQLTYCNIIWAAAYKSSLTKINSLQKRALKLCLSKSYQWSRTNNFQSQEDERSAVSVFKRTNRLSVQNINLCQALKFIY